MRIIPRCKNFSELIANSNFQHFFLNSVIVTICVVVIFHGDFHFRGVQPGANWVLRGQSVPGYPAIFLTYA